MIYIFIAATIKVPAANLEPVTINEYIILVLDIEITQDY